MIKVAHHQHDGSFLRLSWDLGTSILDSSTIDTEARADFYFHESGSLAEQFPDGFIELL
jgi:hypothetical protein